MITVTTQRYGAETDLILAGDGDVLIERVATFFNDNLADRCATLLNAFGLDEDDADPMEPNNQELAQREYMTATAQSRADAEVL